MYNNDELAVNYLETSSFHLEPAVLVLDIEVERKLLP